MSEVTSHYSFGGLRSRIENGLAQLGGSPTMDSLGAVDEFHVGGRPATAHLLQQLALTANDHVLDIGSGLGGPARFIAAETGVDLTAEYVEVASWLTELVDMGDRVSFLLGSADALPDSVSSITAATMVHVGMNIADKAEVFSQVASALPVGGHFAIYDIMLANVHRSSEPNYPMPWAATAGTSALETAAGYCAILEKTGFVVDAVNDRSEAAVLSFSELAKAAANGPGPLGLHLVMGDTAPTKISNLASAIREGALAPTEIIARR